MFSCGARNPQDTFPEGFEENEGGSDVEESAPLPTLLRDLEASPINIPQLVHFTLCSYRAEHETTKWLIR